MTLMLLCFLHTSDARPAAGLLVRALLPDWPARGLCIRVTP